MTESELESYFRSLDGHGDEIGCAAAAGRDQESHAAAGRAIAGLFAEATERVESHEAVRRARDDWRVCVMAHGFAVDSAADLRRLVLDELSSVGLPELAFQAGAFQFDALLESFAALNSDELEAFSETADYERSLTQTHLRCREALEAIRARTRVDIERETLEANEALLLQILEDLN